MERETEADRELERVRRPEENGGEERVAQAVGMTERVTHELDSIANVNEAILIPA